MLINAEKNCCYRICHIKNISEIFQNGLCNKYHPKASKTYINIGNTEIIDVRDEIPVRISGYGNVGEYVPFYFTPMSIMLFNIVTGFRQPIVPKRQKEDIIVIRCRIKDLSVLGKFFFTDGQANEQTMTKHYYDLADLDKIDWGIIHNSDFKRNADDTDKTRRYQAEFLVHSYVPANVIESINVYNEKGATFVQAEMAKTDLIIPIRIVKEYFFN